MSRVARRMHPSIPRDGGMHPSSNKCAIKADYCRTTFNLKKILWVSYNCQTRIIWCVYKVIPLFNNIQFERHKEQRRFNDIKIKLINERIWPKSIIISKLNWEDFISEHENESGNYSQFDIQKSFKINDEKKFEFLMSHHLSPVVVIFMKREIIFALMFNQIKILITSKNSEMLQT